MAQRTHWALARLDLCARMKSMASKMWALRRRIILWWRSGRARARCKFQRTFKRGRDGRNAQESAVRVTAYFAGGGQRESAIELRFAVAEQAGRAANSHGKWHSLRRLVGRESD